MKTPTHLIIGYGCSALLGWRGGLRRACLVGAVVPDVPVAVVWAVLAAGVAWREGGFRQAAVQAEMDALYFSDSLMIGLHNLLHAPFSLLGLALLSLVVFRRAPRWRGFALAFLVGAFSHALADIVSHVTDGPLLLWPLDDSLRLAGPFSHWDPLYGGLWVSLLEAAAALVFGLCALAARWRRRARPAVAEP